MFSESLDFEHTGPGTLAGCYLRLFWHPVYRAEDLAPGQAVPIQILSEWFTLYRGDGGTPHLLAFRCAHRGTQLSTGWVEDDCIRCLYHGWKYDATGQCVEQPGEDASFAAKVQIRRYPLEEYLGLFFAYLGDGPVPPLRRYPDFEKPGVLLAIPPERWPCNYYNRLDNDADAAHVVFTHAESTTRGGTPQSRAGRDVSAEMTEYGVRTTFAGPGRPKDFLHGIMPTNNQLRVKIGMARPDEPGASVWEDRLTWAVPIDDEHSLRFEINLVHLTGEAAEAHRDRFRALQASLRPASEWGDLILAGKLAIRDLGPEISVYQMFRIEDYVTQVGQGRIANRALDRFGTKDVGVVLRRKLWQRELAALAKGSPLTEWRVPEGLADMSPETLQVAR
jgi:5,5'-dehydrodivanillate O-demethylase